MTINQLITAEKRIGRKGYCASIGDLWSDDKPTKTEAKASLTPQILAACTDHQPHFTSVADTWIVTYSTDGIIWGYQLLGRPNNSARIEYGAIPRGALCLGFHSEPEALRSARYHLAQQTESLEDALQIADPEDHTELTSILIWQEQYRKARDEGYTDQAAREIAFGWKMD